MTGFQMKEKVLEGDPKVANIRKHTAFSHFQPADLAGIDWTGVDHLHVTGIPLALSESCRETIYTLMMRAHSKGVHISFDPNLRPMLWNPRKSWPASLTTPPSMLTSSCPASMKAGS